MLKNINKENAAFIAVVIAAFVGLYFVSQQNYLLFHGIAEGFSIMIAFAIFIFAWNSRRMIENRFFLMIGIAYLFVGSLDFVHILAYKGMGVFTGYGTNLATQLWIGARYLESLSILAAMAFINKKIKIGPILLGYITVFCLLLLSIFYWEVFPVCFIDGAGLTVFKITSEYIISAILLASIFLLWQRRSHFDKNVLMLLIWAVVATILSELSFTLYTDAYGIANVLGHFLKIISFYFLYRAIIKSGLEKPYTILFKSLKDSQEKNEIISGNFKRERDFARSVLDTAQVIILTLDTRGRITQFNPYMEELSGYTLEEVEGKDWFETFIPERNKEQTKKIFSEALNDISTIASEDIIVTKNRQELLIEWYDKTLKDQNGNVTGLLSIGQDITKRKQAESSLVDSEIRYRRLFETAQDAILILNGDTGEIIDANPFIKDLLGYNLEELLGKNLWEIGSLRDTLASKLVYQELHETGYVRYEHLPLFTKDGRQIDVEVVANAYPVDHQRIIQCNIRDITERKKAENTRKQSETRYKVLFEGANDAIIIADAETGLIVDANKEAEVLLGIPKEELIGMSRSKLHPPDKAEFYQRHFSDHVKAGHIIDSTAEIIRKDGTVVPVSVSSSTFEVDGKKLVQGIFRDMSQVKRAEEERHRLRERAEIASRLAAIGEMAAGIAHEINNPLTGVLGFSQILSERQDLPKDVKEELEIIAEGSNRVKEIIRRMLTFARQAKPVKTPASINELIDTTLDLRSYVLKTANIEVIKHLDPDLPWLMVDPGQIQQVFLNLIVNAEYAMKKAHDKGKLTITTEKKDDHIRVSFQDDGVGMNQETKEKLFHPFFTTKEIGEGAGLGLGLSRSIILEHNGTIEVKSELGKGSEFIIMLPLTIIAEGPPAEVIDATAALAKKVKAGRILVVDDEEVIRKLVSTILSQSGHTVDTTGDTRKALSKLESTGYDAIIMDIRMPGIGGMELYAKVTEKHPELSSKFIFITGDTSDTQIRDFLEQNNLSYITKPFVRETLLGKLNRLL